MLRVRVSKVTSDYLRDELRVEPGVWYDAKPDELTGADVIFPGSEGAEGTKSSYILIGGGCAHLSDNEQTEWEVSRD